MRLLSALLLASLAALANAEPQTNLLSALSAPILFKGDGNVGCRDPLLLWHNGTFHMFFTLGVREKGMPVKTAIPVVAPFMGAWRTQA